MGTGRFADLQTRPTEVLDVTSLAVEEVRALVPPFEAAFQAPMAAWRLDGRRRTARRRVRLEPVTSRVQRCRMVHETNRLRKAGGRDRVLQVCGARHTFGVRLTPWQPMV
jgi:hypothetical protein